MLTKAVQFVHMMIVHMMIGLSALGIRQHL